MVATLKIAMVIILYAKINGKYLVDATHAGSQKKIFEVVDYLIQKESQ